MAKTTDAANNTLAEFNFDDNEEFFGIKGSKDTTPNNIKETTKPAGTKSEETTEIKEVKTDADDEEIKDDVEFFGIPSDKKTSGTSTSKKSKAGKQDDIIVEKDDDDNDEVTSINKKTKSKKEVVEDSDDESDDRSETKETKETKEGKTVDNEEDEVSDEEFYGTLSFDLKERGIFQNIELPKEKKLTEDQFFEFFDAEMEARVDEAIEGMVENLDEDAKRFLKFKKDGGKTHEFFAQYANSLDLDDLDVTKEDQVNKVLAYHITTVEGLEGEELEDRMKFIKEGGKAKILAEKWFTRIKAEEDEVKDQMIKAAAEAKKSRELNSKKFNEEIAALALKTEAVGDFTFSKTDQKKIIASITKATVKVGKDRYIPEFQAKLHNILKANTKEDKEKLLILAKLLDTDFDIKDLAIKKRTEVTREAKSNLREAKKGVKAHSTGGNKQRELSDFF